MKLRLAYYGHPVLRTKCAPVAEINDDIRTLVQDMVEALIEYNGIGLAAPQIHRPIRLFITAVPIEQPDGKWAPGTLRIFINPEIIWLSEEQDVKSEGCLSIPSLHGDVIRPIEIKVRATDLDGNEFELELKDLEARCFLHENDHINGVLFIDRIQGKERKLLDPKLKEIKKKYSSQK